MLRVRVEEHLVPHGELHVPLVRVKRLLAPILTLLHQRAQLQASNVGEQPLHPRRSGIWGHRRRGRGQGGGVLAAVGVEGHVLVASAELRRRIVDSVFDQLWDSRRALNGD